MEQNWILEKASFNSVNSILNILKNAQDFMIKNNNPNQWGRIYPSKDVIENDIQNEDFFLVKNEQKIIGVFCFLNHDDPTYKKIFGRWKNKKPYGVIHRIASSFEYKGILNFVVSWCFKFCDNLRIDTHFKNKPMRRSLKKIGFKFCGFIRCHNQTIRLAYQKEK